MEPAGKLKSVEELTKFNSLTEKGKRRLDHICLKATEVLGTKGYLSTSLADISRATSISKGGLYHYFSTKEELLLLILSRYMKFILSGLEEDLKTLDTPRSKIHFLIHRHISIYCSHINESRLLFHEMHLLPGPYLDYMVDLCKDYLQFWMEAVEEFLAGHQVSQDQVRVASLSLLGMCNWIYLWYNPQGAVRPSQLADYIFGIFVGDFFKPGFDVFSLPQGRVKPGKTC